MRVMLRRLNVPGLSLFFHNIDRITKRVAGAAQLMLMTGENTAVLREDRAEDSWTVHVALSRDPDNGEVVAHGTLTSHEGGVFDIIRGLPWMPDHVLDTPKKDD